MLYSILVAIDVLLAIAIVGLVLIQQGKGADAGAAFGSGSSGTVFGAQGSASFLTKLTTVLAIAFFIISLWLAHLASNRPVAESVIDTTVIEETANENSASDVPGSDQIPAAESMSSDVPELDQDMQQNDSTESSNDVPSETEAVVEDALDNIDDSMESMQKDVKTTLDKVTPNDVPE